MRFVFFFSKFAKRFGRFLEQKADSLENKHQIYVWMSQSLPFLLTRVEDPHGFVLKLLLELPRVPKQKMILRVDLPFLLTSALLRAGVQVFVGVHNACLTNTF